MLRLIALLTRAASAGRGRWAALSLLVLMCVVHAAPMHSPLERVRLAWFDFYQVALPRERHSTPVTIVAVDERSLLHLGQWPWPRTLLAALIERIGELGAAAIGLDILMPEADQTSPEALARRIDSDQKAVISALQSMPAYDALLANTIKRYPVVLGAAGFDNATPSTMVGLRTWPLVVRGGEISKQVRNYPYTLASLPRLQAAASGQALISVDLERGVLRRVPMVSTIGATTVPALSIELVRVARGAQSITVDLAGDAIRAVSVDKVQAPTQSSGEYWLHFTPSVAARYVSALTVLRDRIEPKEIKDKIVIVALTGLGLVDYKTTPLGEYVPGVEMHAQLIESFIDGRHLLRPSWMEWAEVGGLALAGSVLIIAVPGMRRHVAIVLVALLLLAIIGLGFALFHWTGLLFDASSLIIALSIVFASLFVSALVQADRERRATQRSLRLAREMAARVEGELEAARRIQLGVLPDSESSFPNETRFDLAAEIEPARAVGGDLYDFFMLDDDRLFVIVADVSGKGIPASLFMSVTKALTKSIALREGRDASQVLTQANVEISRDNPESLFVTAFAAILNVRTGHLRYWTAGHDTPFLYRGGTASAQQIDRSLSGPPLCVLDEYDYPEQQLQLTPGDGLVLFTDGISEAEDNRGNQYGKERLARCLDALPKTSQAEVALQTIRADVSAFVAGAPASDDLTLLVLRWLGPSGTFSGP